MDEGLVHHLLIFSYPRLRLAHRTIVSLHLVPRRCRCLRISYLIVDHHFHFVDAPVFGCHLRILLRVVRWIIAGRHISHAVLVATLELALLPVGHLYRRQWTLLCASLPCTGVILRRLSL